MAKISEIEQHLCEIYPLSLAESWDNVGLLLGRRAKEVNRVMTCLTLSPDVAAEAIKENIDLIISHHPFPFKPQSKYTDSTVDGGVLLDLIENRIAVYSPHTAFDSAREGINARTLLGLGFTNFEAIFPKEGESVGVGRMVKGEFELEDLLERVGKFYQLNQMTRVEGKRSKVQRVGVICGSGGDFIAGASAKGVDFLITGEASFHQCVLARSLGMHLVLTGHYQSERFALEELALGLARKFTKVKCLASQSETNPLQSYTHKHSMS